MNCGRRKKLQKINLLDLKVLKFVTMFWIMLNVITAVLVLTFGLIALCPIFSHDQIYSNLLNFLVVNSVLVIAMSCVGLCAAYKKMPPILLIYITVTSVFTLVMLCASVYVTVRKMEIREAILIKFRLLYFEDLLLYKDNYKTRQRIDTMQTDDKCCGFYNANDYIKLNMTMPTSCCTVLKCTVSNAFKGCEIKFLEIAKSYNRAYYPIFGLTILQFMSFAFGRLMYSRMEDHRTYSFG